MESARMAETELGAKVVVVSKSSSEYAAMKNAPPCPSVELNGALLAENGTVTFDQIKAALTKMGKG